MKIRLSKVTAFDVRAKGKAGLTLVWQVKKLPSRPDRVTIGREPICYLRGIAGIYAIRAGQGITLGEDGLGHAIAIVTELKTHKQAIPFGVCLSVHMAMSYYDGARICFLLSH